MKQPRKRRRLVRWIGIAGVLLFAAGPVAMWLWPAHPPAPRPLPPGPYNVVLLVMDTVRADHVHCYGYERTTTPRLDEIAMEGTRFTRAMSTAPWTLPSHASMFTGLAPHEHRAHTFDIQRRETNNVAPLPSDVPVIAEVFQELGYATGAFSANNVYLGPRWGLDRGFDAYEVEHAYATEKNRTVLEWLDGIGDEPFFLFVNYMDAHRPYNVEEVDGLLDHPPDQNAWLIDHLKDTVMTGRDTHPERLIEAVTAQYDTGIANLDIGIGQIVDALEEREELENTILVVISDHGEYLGEHQLVEHNLDVYQEALHVPLVVRSPMDLRGVEDHRLVTSADVPYLIRSRLRDKSASRAFKRFDSPRRHGVSENYYSRPWDIFNPDWGERFRRVRHVIYDWPYKYIQSSDGEDELYSLESDAGEQNNLVETVPGVARRLARSLDRDLRDHEEVPEQVRDPSLSDLEIEQMRALGYAE